MRVLPLDIFIVKEPERLLLDGIGRVPLRPTDVAVAVIPTPIGTPEEIEEIMAELDSQFTSHNCAGAKYRGLIVGNAAEPAEIARSVSMPISNFRGAEPELPAPVRVLGTFTPRSFR